MVDYHQFHAQQQKDVQQIQLETAAAIMIQKITRGWIGRRAATHYKLLTKYAICLQRAIRGKLARLHAEKKRIRREAAIIIQKYGRRYIAQKMVGVMLRKERELKRKEAAAKVVWKQWRRYRAQRNIRRLLARFNSPKTRKEWESLRNASTRVRKVGAWIEFLMPNMHDVYFWVTEISKRYTWDKPTTVEESDLRLYRMGAELKSKGFTIENEQAALRIQSQWRAKKARRGFSLLLRSVEIKNEAPRKYKENPTSIVNVCNYFVFVHAFLHDEDLARELVNKAMEYMSTRGPDNAFVLYAYAIFIASTGEEEFEDVWGYIMRAKAVDPRRDKFTMAMQGFYRQASIQQPDNPQAQSNFALCLHLVTLEFDEAEHYYLRAMTLNGANLVTQRNLEILLRQFKHADYTVFDIFHKYQEELALKEAGDWAAGMSPQDREQMKQARVMAAIKIQRKFKARKFRHFPLTFKQIIMLVRESKYWVRWKAVRIGKQERRALLEEWNAELSHEKLNLSQQSQLRLAWVWVMKRDKRKRMFWWNPINNKTEYALPRPVLLIRRLYSLQKLIRPYLTRTERSVVKLQSFFRGVRERKFMRKRWLQELLAIESAAGGRINCTWQKKDTPEGVSRQFSPMFYWNPVTNETKWHKPQEEVLRDALRRIMVEI